MTLQAPARKVLAKARKRLVEEAALEALREEIDALDIGWRLTRWPGEPEGQSYYVATRVQGDATQYASAFTPASLVRQCSLRLYMSRAERDNERRRECVQRRLQRSAEEVSDVESSAA